VNPIKQLDFQILMLKLLTFQTFNKSVLFNSLSLFAIATRT